MIIFVILCFLSVSVNGNIFNKNSTDLSKCKVHYSRPESKYKEFYSLVDTPGKNETLELDFHFAVLAPSDAHILLASSVSIQKQEPAYEIVIGAGGNSFSDIRRKQKSDVKASYRRTGLLSALDPRFFWIHVSKDGIIEVGKEGEELAFISWIDPDPLPIRFVSFSTWSGIEAKWYFFCERNNETEEIELALTGTKKLMRDLLYHYDSFVRPVMDHTTITTVMIALQINHIELNEHKCSIQLISQMKMVWLDEKLKWDPLEYDNLDYLRIISSEIWQPDIMVYNDNGNGPDVDAKSLALVHSDGLVEWNPVLHINAWCDIEDLGVWPKDKHKCSLIFAVRRDFNHINMEFVKNESSLVRHSSSKWFVLEADMISGRYGNDSWDPPILTLTLVLQRQSNFYNTIFFTPFIIISVCILLSFWSDPFGPMKISLICAQLVLATLLLLTLGMIAPNHSKHVPHLVSLYSYSMVAILVALIVSIIVINISRRKDCKPIPHFLCAVLTSDVLKFGLCLPKIKMSDEYGKLNDSVTKSQEKGQLMWIQLGVAIDRIAFLLYLGLTIYVIYSFY